MANIKKTVKDEVVVEKNTTTSSNDELKIMLEAMSQQFKAMQEMNETLLKENQNLKENLLNTKATSNKDDDKVYVVHLRDMRDTGLTTHISLSNTSRDLTIFGETVSFSVNDFQELVSKYRGFFEKGIIAVDAKNFEYAEQYRLPVYDSKTQVNFTAETFTKLGTMSNKELTELFDKLSYPNQQRILEYWLGKCYEKDTNFLNREKMAFLDRLSDSQVFEDLMFELDNNARGMGKGNKAVEQLGRV